MDELAIDAREASRLIKSMRETQSAAQAEITDVFEELEGAGGDGSAAKE